MSDVEQLGNGEWTHIETVRRGWAFLPGFAASFISYCPQYRDTKSGRRNAAQIRAVLLFVGISIIAFAELSYLGAGVLLCSLAIVIPVLDSRKRAMIRDLKRMKSTEKTKTRSVEFEIDDTHFETTLADEKFRSKRRAVKIERGPNGKQISQFKHVSKKTKIWIRSSEDVTETDDSIRVDRSRVTDVIDVDAKTFARLRGN